MVYLTLPALRQLVRAHHQRGERVGVRGSSGYCGRRLTVDKTPTGEVVSTCSPPLAGRG